MDRCLSRRREGAVLLFALLALIGGLALTSAMINISVSDSRAMRECLDRSQAFYLAEGGLHASHWELGERQDPAGDGEGTCSSSVALGTFSVSVADLGSSLYRLTATGNSGISSVVMEEVVELRPKSRFPGGAISIVGGMATDQLLFSQTTDLVVDGGNSPGVVFTDEDLYDDITSAFAQAVGLGYLQESDVTGSVTNTFQPGDVDLSMAYYPSAHEGLTIYPTMYTEFFNHIDNNLQGSAIQEQIGSGSYVFGSAESPVNYRFPGNQKLKAGQTVSGHGTLIFSQNLIMEPGSTVNWNGNLIIFGGDNQSDAYLECDGKLNVTGNVILVGPQGRDVKFLIKSQGQVTVDGALTVMADLSNTTSKLEFYVENDFIMNGLLTTVAPIHQTEFKPGSDTIINGSFQLGRPDAAQNTKLQLKFDDAVQVYKDDDQIAVGAAALEALGGNLSLPVLGETLNRQDVTTKYWRVLPSP